MGYIDYYLHSRLVDFVTMEAHTIVWLKKNILTSFGSTTMVLNKNKNSLFFEINHIFQFFSIFPNFYWNFFNFLKEKSILRDFLRNFKKISQKFEFFHFLLTFWWFFKIKFEFVSLLIKKKCWNFFFFFFVFCLQKTPIFFWLLQKIKIQKNGNHRQHWANCLVYNTTQSFLVFRAKCPK